MPQTIKILEQPSGPPPSMWDRMRAFVRSYTVTPISIKERELVEKLFGEGQRTTAGVHVSDHNIWTFSAVYDAVNQSSGDVAKVPLDLKKRRQGGDGGTDDFEKSNTYWLLKYAANPDMSAFEFRRTMQAHALVYKGAFAEIERDGAGRPAALWPLTPDRVEPFVEKERLTNGNFRGRLRYRVDGDKIIEAADMLHIRGLGYDGYCAYPVIDKARQAIGIALAAQNFAGAFYGNNASFGGLLTAEQGLTTDQVKDLRASLEKQFRGSDRAWKLLVLGAGFKYQRAGITPQDAQFNDTRATQVEEVARFFNMPVHKLKNLDRATNNNIEQQDLEYYKGHLLTWFTNWEQELNRKLIPSLEIGNQYFKHNVKGFLRGDTAAQTALYTAMLDRGVFNADEVREYEDLNPQPGGQGKLYLVQGAMVPKDQIVDMAKATIDAKTQPKQPVNPPPPQPQPDPNAADTKQRMEQAEAMAREAQADAAKAREALAAAESAGTVRAEEVAGLRTAVERADLLASHSTALAESMRADLASTQARMDTLTEAHQRVLEQLVSVQAERDAAIEREARKTAEMLAIQAERDGLADQMDALVQSLRTSNDTIAALTAERDSLKTEESGLREAMRAADLESIEAASEVDRLKSELTKIDPSIVEAAEEAKRQALVAADQARQALTTAEQRAVDAEQALTAERARLAAIAAEQRALAEQKADVSTALAAAQIELSVLQQSTERAISEVRAMAEAAQQRAETVKAEALKTEADKMALSDQFRDLEAKFAEALREKELLATSMAAAQQRAEAVQAEALKVEAEKASIEEKVRDLEAKFGEAIHEKERLSTSMSDAHERAIASVRAEAEQAIQDAKRLEADAMAMSIAAHRDLFVQIMRKAIERETDRARQNNRHPEKLAKWVDTFYETHADLMRAALLPAMRVHLAFIRSDEDPVEATRRYVEDHVRRSQRELRDLLEDDLESYAVSVPALLARWDADRPTELADLLMTKELDYARRA